MKTGEKYPVSFRVGALTVQGGGHLVIAWYNADNKPSLAQLWAGVLERFNALGYNGPLEVDETSLDMRLVAEDKLDADRPRFQTFSAYETELTYSGEELLADASGPDPEGDNHG